jgi:threonine/homoserine/homoserine lactone efflux protein
MPDIILFKGILLGFMIAAVVGPIGIICLRRSIASGFLSGLSVGIGAALADALYGAIAAFGLTFVSKTLLYVIPVLRIVGGVYLLYLGFNAFFKKAQLISELRVHGIWNTIISIFLLTLTNPVTILSFIALFTGAHVHNLVFADTTTLVFGIFSGSMLWWLLLSTIGSIIGKRITAQTIVWINRGSGIVIALFGLLTIFMTVRR